MVGFNTGTMKKSAALVATVRDPIASNIFCDELVPSDRRVLARGASMLPRGYQGLFSVWIVLAVERLCIGTPSTPSLQTIQDGDKYNTPP
jgi:hypothetical protein